MAKEQFYTCRKCGTQLFTKEDVLHEDVANADTGTDGIAAATENAETPSVSSVKAAWGRLDKGGGASKLPCSSVFLTESPKWVSDASSHDGRLTCPKCNARVGSFSWSGATCSCGRWVTPAFQFQLARVDARQVVSISDVSSSHIVQSMTQPLLPQAPR